MTAHRSKTLRAVSALLTMFCVIVCLCQQRMGQDSGAEDKAGQERSIRLEPVKQIRADVDAFPLIEHPQDPVERRVNATLLQLNREMEKTLRDCDADVAEFEKQPGTTGKENNDVSEDWSRNVEVTMRGPRFLSMIAQDGFFCGGGHPDDNLTVVVFDLRSGTLVDWVSFLAKEAGATSTKDVLGYADGTRPLVLAELQKLYLAAEEGDCKDYFEDKQSFLLWPDSKSGALVAEVAGLPHVAAPCKIDFKLTLEQARKLGFSEELLRAIQDGQQEAAGGR